MHCSREAFESCNLATNDFGGTANRDLYRIDFAPQDPRTASELGHTKGDAIRF